MLDSTTTRLCACKANSSPIHYTRQEDSPELVTNLLSCLQRSDPDLRQEETEESATVFILSADLVFLFLVTLFGALLCWVYRNLRLHNRASRSKRQPPKRRKSRVQKNRARRHIRTFFLRHCSTTRAKKTRSYSSSEDSVNFGNPAHFPPLPSSSLSPLQSSPTFAANRDTLSPAICLSTPTKIALQNSAGPPQGGLRRSKPVEEPLHPTTRRPSRAECTSYSASQTLHSQSTAVHPLVSYGLTPGVRELRRTDACGIYRVDWRCTCGYENFQARLQCRNCGQPGDVLKGIR